MPLSLSLEIIIHSQLCISFPSGQGETVISILTDLNGFWAYENREVLLAETQEVATG